MALFLPQRWRQQPQGAVEVDWGNSLATRLDGLLLFTGGAWREIASQYPLTVNSRGIGVSLIGRGGPGDEVTGTGGTGIRSSAGRSQRANDMEVSLFIHGAVLPSAVVPSGIEGAELIRAGQTYISRANFNTPRYVIFEMLFTDFTSCQYDAGTILDFGKPYSLSLSRRTGAGGFNCYHDRRLIRSADGLSAATRGDEGVSGWNLGINSRGDGGSGHIIPLGARWRRALSDGEHLALHENPWQLLRPLRPIVYSLPSPVPVLSSPTVIDIGSNSARPRVTFTI